jgi:hypothetical protein
MSMSQPDIPTTETEDARVQHAGIGSDIRIRFVCSGNGVWPGNQGEGGKNLQGVNVCRRRCTLAAEAE